MAYTDITGIGERVSPEYAPCREMDAPPTPQGHPITKQGGL